MSVLAVKEYLRTTLVAGQPTIIANAPSFTKVDVYRQVPKFEKLGTGLFIVIGPYERTEERMSVPRGSGQKKIRYAQKLFVMAAGKDEQAVGDSFDTAFENLSQVIRTANVQVGIADPVTAATSWLMELGEVMVDRSEEPQLSQQAGLARFFAEKDLTVLEVITA